MVSVVPVVVGLAGCSTTQDGALAQQLAERSASAQEVADGGPADRPTPQAREQESAQDLGRQIVIDPLPSEWSTPPSAAPTASTLTPAASESVAAEPLRVTVTEAPSSGPPTDANGNELVTPPAAPMGVAGEGQVVPINDIGGSFTAECAGGEVQISGIDNTVTISGHCARLTVSGVDNVIVVDSFGELNLSGVRNHLTYLQGEYTEEPGGIDCVVVKG